MDIRLWRQCDSIVVGSLCHDAWRKSYGAGGKGGGAHGTFRGPLNSQTRPIKYRGNRQWDQQRRNEIRCMHGLHTVSLLYLTCWIWRNWLGVWGSECHDRSLSFCREMHKNDNLYGFSRVANEISVILNPMPRLKVSNRRLRESGC